MLQTCPLTKISLELDPYHQKSISFGMKVVRQGRNFHGGSLIVWGTLHIRNTLIRYVVQV